MTRPITQVVSALAAGLGMALAAAGASAPAAQAFTLTFDGAYGSTNSTATGASAQVDFDFESADAAEGDLWLHLTVRNTTSGGSIVDDGFETAGADEAKLMGFGFDLLDGIVATGYTADGSGYFNNAWFDGGVGFSGKIGGTKYNDLAIGIGHNGKANKLGGGNTRGALEALQSTKVSFLLDADLFETDRTADDVKSAFAQAFSQGSLKAAARFQSVNAGAGSDKIVGGIQPAPDLTDETLPDVLDLDSTPGSIVVSPTAPQGVPEPSVLLGLAIAGGLARGLRRRNADFAAEAV